MDFFSKPLRICQSLETQRFRLARAHSRTVGISACTGRGLCGIAHVCCAVLGMVNCLYYFKGKHRGDVHSCVGT